LTTVGTLCVLRGATAYAVCRSTCNVPTEDYPTISAALADGSCTVVNIASGTFNEHVAITRTVAIQGQGAPNTTIDGGQAGRVFYVEPGVEVTLTNLTIANGLSPFYPGTGHRQPGAGIYMEDSRLVISSTVVKGNVGGNGAGLYSKGGVITIQASDFFSNECSVPNVTYGGGALFTEFTSTVAISDSLFAANRSNQRGGAIQIRDGSLTLVGSSVISNEADVGGGISGGAGLYGSGDSFIVIKGSSLIGNDAREGSAIANYPGGVLQLDNVLIEGNTRDRAIQNNGWMTLSHSAINENSGAMLNDAAGIAFVEDSEITNNGAAIWNRNVLTVTSSVLYGNHGDYGGAIYNHPYGGVARLYIVDSMLNGNAAELRGGAIYNSGEATINGASLIGNVAGQEGYTAEGGAIFNDLGSMTITNSTLASNISSYAGGAIYCDGGQVTLVNSTVTRNYATFGGALVNYADSVTAIANSILVANGGSSTCGGDPTSLGHNIFSDDTCNPDQSDLINVTPVLLPLSYADGRGLVYQLLPGSIAIDAAGSEHCPPVDQRGTNRPLDGDGDGTSLCDVGSYEFDRDNPPDFMLLFLSLVLR
jgi:hypothetical protein